MTVVEVDLDTRADGLPLYRVVDRRLWTGVRHTALHEQLVELARETWKASWVVVDATGIGAGLASFLGSSLGRRRKGQPTVHLEPFVFSAASKSRLGWDFLGLIDGGRFREYAPGPDCHPEAEPTVSSRAKSRDLAKDVQSVTAEYYRQLRATTFEVRNGPGNLLRWSVPARDGHDDLVVSAALCAALDRLDHRHRIARGHGG